MSRLLPLVLVGLAVSCAGGEGVETPADIPTPEDSLQDVDSFQWGADAGEDLDGGDLGLVGEVQPLDLAPDLPSCEAGEGCFGDPCEENEDCISGWCVQHMGDSVCSQECLEDCPQSWSCKQVAGTDPDVVYICVSSAAHLCIPCTAAADCKEGVALEDACVDYGAEGAFCGAVCLEDVDCPGGFACEDRLTVDGIETRQCVAAAGVCECSQRSILLGLFTHCHRTNDLGVCEGKRVCTDDGLSPCDAFEPAEEICNAADDDCDGQVDEVTCDDGNGCTADSCAGADGCQHEAIDGGECLDGDPCTVGDHCEFGVCVGTALDCDDDDPCTDDSCDGVGGCQFTPNTLPCDDLNPCTVGDQCGGGGCQGTLVDCDCQEDADCVDLEDGDICNGVLVCDLTKLPYSCVVDPETVVACPTPEGVDAFCQVPVCAPDTGACGFDPANEDGACEDGDPCTFGDVCQAGACLAGPPLPCDDNNPCTVDSCDADEGCVFTPAEGDCDDGNACTTGDVCAEGGCIGAAILECDDGNPCTDNSCDPAQGCVTSLNAASCDDGDACTTGDHCHLGGCIGGQTQFCDDGNLCTDDTCDPGQGCVLSPNIALCDDGNPCTLVDQCGEGSCQAGAAKPCNDADGCTVDSCDPNTGDCVFLPLECGPSDLCGASVCDSDIGACKYTPTDCSDGDPCTIDSCDADSGDCVHEDLVCDDANPCTVDACESDTGVCVFQQVVCDDQDACTIDFCDVVSGDCVAVGLDCGDENACTIDTCDPGTGDCQYDPIDCADDNPCTDDSCDPAGGTCLHDFNTAPCEGGQCLNGECVEDCQQTWYGWAGIGTNNGWTCVDVCGVGGGVSVDWDGLAEQQYYCHLLHPDAIEFVANPSSFSYPIWEPQHNRCKLNANGVKGQNYAGNGTTEYGDQIFCKCENSQCGCVPDAGNEDGMPCDFKDNDCDGEVDENCVDGCGDGYVLAFDITDDGTDQLPNACSWLGTVLFDKGTKFKFEWWSAAGVHFGPATWDLSPQINSIRQNYDTCSGSNYAMGSEDGNWYLTLVQVNNIITITGWGDDPANGTDHYYGRIQNGYTADDEVYAVDYPDWETAWANRYTPGDRFRVCYKP